MSSQKTKPQYQHIQQAQIYQNQYLNIQKQPQNDIFQVKCNKIIIRKQLLKPIHFIQQICFKKFIKIDIFKVGNYLSKYPLLQDLSTKTQDQISRIFQYQTCISLQKIPNLIKQQIKKLDSLYQIFQNQKVLSQKHKQNVFEAYKLQKQDLKNFIFKKTIQILAKLQNLKKSSADNNKFKYQKVQNVIEKVILKIERQIFINSILAIEQLQLQCQFEQKCKIYLQQCYIPIIRNKSEILNVMGQKRYNYFRSIFVAYSSNNLQNKSIYQFYKLCHFCSKHFSLQNNALSEKNVCKFKINPNKVQQIQCNYFYPQLYYQRKVCSNFKMIYSQRKYQIIPYFISQSNQHKACLRIICNQCIKTNKKKGISNCDFCEGICNCKRCVLADKLSKILSYWSKGNSQKISLTISKFIMNY